MRDELHLMELVDRYLDGSMNTEERTAFEARANTNAELRQLIADQRALREGVARLALRTIAVNSAPATGMGWIAPMITTIAIVVVATIAWVAWSGRSEGDTPPVQEELNPVSAPDSSEGASPAEEEAVVAPERSAAWADTQVVIKTVQVPANITAEGRQAIIDSMSTRYNAIAVDASNARAIALQNVLTPDGDGVNDRLIVPGGPYLKATMTVRSGQNMVVFSQEAQDPIWDGNLTNGKPAPAGVYVCEVTAVDPAGRMYVGKENVQLVREAKTISIQ